MLMIAEVVDQPRNDVGLQPVRPEELKTHVYLPPEILARHPHLSVSVADIVQKYTEGIGVSSATDYLKAKAAAGNVASRWDPPHPHPSPAPPDFDSFPLVPPPVSASEARFIFPGRPRGTLSAFRQDTEVTDAPLANSSATSLNEPDDYAAMDDFFLSIQALGVLDLFEEKDALLRKLSNVQRENHCLHSMLADYQAEISSIRNNWIIQHGNDREAVREVEHLSESLQALSDSRNARAESPSPPSSDGSESRSSTPTMHSPAPTLRSQSYSSSPRTPFLLNEDFDSSLNRGRNLIRRTSSSRETSSTSSWQNVGALSPPRFVQDLADSLGSASFRASLDHQGRRVGCLTATYLQWAGIGASLSGRLGHVVRSLPFHCWREEIAMFIDGGLDHADLLVLLILLDIHLVRSSAA